MIYVSTDCFENWLLKCLCTPEHIHMCTCLSPDTVRCLINLVCAGELTEKEVVYVIYVAAQRHSSAQKALQAASLLGSSLCIVHGVWHSSPQGRGLDQKP